MRTVKNLKNVRPDQTRHGGSLFTREYYLAILHLQEFRCAICKRHRSEFKRDFAADHCHVTGKNRGLLCTSCNLMLGNAHDNIEILLNAISYLNKYN